MKASAAVPKVKVGESFLTKSRLRGIKKGTRVLCFNLGELHNSLFDFILPNGQIVTFNKENLEDYIDLKSAKMTECLKGYRFTHIDKLEGDFKAGLFRAAFE